MRPKMLLLLLFVTQLLAAQSNTHKIQSEALGYTIGYTVVLPDGYDASKTYPAIYLTDGPMVEKRSTFLTRAKAYQRDNKRPFVSVFVSHEQPGTEKTRRNYELLANPKYLKFLTQELVKTVERTYAVSASPNDRFLNGLSFGGLNALYIGLEDKGQTFGNIAALSPAIHPKKYLKDAYKNGEKLPIRFFVSSGDHDDNEVMTRKIRDVLKSRGYEMGYNEVPYAHTLKNWNANWLPMLEFFFGK
ncbi:alpha/beta hydrolase-fold protein [Flavobacteriaceae bacterium 3-367]